MLELRLHQREALSAVSRTFATGADRCQVVMACGTGKTLLAQRVSERPAIARDGVTVVACPSISLLAQTLAAWKSSSKRPFAYMAACSDPTIEAAVSGADEPADAMESLDREASGALVTTSPDEIKEWLSSRAPGRSVVFSTHASLKRVADALGARGEQADLLIVDEAHNLAGVAKPGSEAAELKLGKLATETFPARRRVYMTATPRIVQPGKGDEEIEVVSMEDDPAGPFGAVTYHLSFAKAVALGLLVDFKVVVQVALTDEVMKKLRSTRTAKVGDIHVTPAELARHYAVHQAAENHGLRRLLSFHNTVRGARTFSERAGAIALELASGAGTANEWLCGEHSAAERKAVLDRLAALEGIDRMVVSSARVLTEGVDVPAVDGVVFVDPRSSVIDIAQAVGRAMRRHTDPVHGEKETGVVVVPVVVPPGADPEEHLSDGDWRTVWKVLDAMKSVDDRLAQLLVERRVVIGRGDGSAVVGTSSAGLCDACGGSSGERGCAVVPDGDRTENGCVGDDPGGIGAQPVDAMDNGEDGDRIAPQGTGGKVSPTLEDRVVFEGVPADWTDDLRLYVVRRSTPSFYEGLGHLQAYKAEHGDCLVPAAFVANDGFKLGSWVCVRRSDRNAGALDEQQIAELDALGFVWAPLDDAWQKGVAVLKAYKAEHGDCLVPKDLITHDGFKLGQWVLSRRQDYKADRLTEERIAELDALGFVWDAKYAAWQSGVAALKAYKAEHGDCLVPAIFVTSDNFKLGQWVRSRRQDRKAGELSEEHITELEAIGFTWGVFDEAWQTGIAALKAYKAGHGDCLVPGNLITHDGFKLGQWVSVRRRERRAGRLSEEREAELDTLGFVWGTR
jgi:superfamily II DNA or RNA helicase